MVMQASTSSSCFCRQPGWRFSRDISPAQVARRSFRAARAYLLGFSSMPSNLAAPSQFACGVCPNHPKRSLARTRVETGHQGRSLADSTKLSLFRRRETSVLEAMWQWISFHRFEILAALLLATLFCCVGLGSSVYRLSLRLTGLSQRLDSHAASSSQAATSSAEPSPIVEGAEGQIASGPPSTETRVRDNFSANEVRQQLRSLIEQLRDAEVAE